MRRIVFAIALVLCAAACESGAAPAAPEAPAASPGASVTGTIRLSQAASVEPGNVLYIIARKEIQGGPPAAVKRIANPVFPVNFELGAADSMVPGIPFEGPLQLKARLSRSGDAMPRPGDIEGVHPGAVQPGQSGIEIILAQEH